MVMTSVEFYSISSRFRVGSSRDSSPYQARSPTETLALIIGPRSGPDRILSMRTGLTELISVLTSMPRGNPRPSSYGSASVPVIGSVTELAGSAMLKARTSAESTLGIQARSKMGPSVR